MALNKENTDIKNTEDILSRQLIYQQALAGCSQALLVPADNKDDQQNVLNQALEHLLSGAQASRAYIFRLFEDAELGLCMGMLAEVCAPGIDAHIEYPSNLKFPLSHLPEEFTNVLAQGKPYGGLVKHVFASTPELKEDLLSQKPPLLSVMFFPLFMREQPWGFIGFDDCISERDWDEREISILRTASEMIGNTLHRWQVTTQLRETLDHLELRVEERTSDLNAEIQERQHAQEDLETRLQIEEILAIISARLLETTEIRANIAASLEDLARIMNAGRIFLAELDQQSEGQVRQFIEWSNPEVPPLAENVLSSSMAYFPELRDRLLEGETIYIDDTTRFQGYSETDLQFLHVRNVHSLVLSPIVIDHNVQAVLGCSNIQASADTVQGNLRTLDLVASMLKSLLQRERLIQMLEEQVAERTRQLTTFLDMAMLSDQAQDLADLLQPTLLSITQIATCDAVAIHIINEEGSSLELIAQRGLPPQYLQPLREIEIEGKLAAWLANGDPHEVSGDPDSRPAFPEFLYPPGFNAFFANRLSTGSNTLGLLSCYRFADQQFSPFQATLLTALGELLGIIVENHRLRIEAGELAAVEERQRLAREIHDAVSQSVYSLSLFSRSARDALDDQNQAKLLASLQDIENTALDAMREMHLLLYHLREAGQEGDIATALETRFKQVEDRLGIQATCEIGSDVILPAHIQYELQRIIIEGLNNVVKHASASRVQVQISCLDKNLIASVWDDGIGFDSSDHFPGMGLKNMQARAGSLGGDLDIVTKSGQGTRMSLKIPIACLDQGEGD